MRYRFLTADVFTNRVFGGNPLAVLPDARGLTTAQMGAIAAEFNLSETTFVLPADDAAHTCRVRIFTPKGEIPFAGHPTVGTAVVLGTIGAVKLSGAETDIVFEENVGPIPVKIFAKDGVPVSARFAVAKLPEEGDPLPPPETLAEVLSLSRADVVPPGTRAAVMSCGSAFSFVPLASRDAVARARLDTGAWEKHLAKHSSPMIFLFTRDTGEDGVHVHSRMFAPSAGITEDPATGSAAAALAGWLVAHEPPGDGTRRWVVQQGIEMGRPSHIELEADISGGKIKAVRVGGGAVMVSEGHIDVP